MPVSGHHRWSTGAFAATAGAGLIALGAAAFVSSASVADTAVKVPAPASDEVAATAPATETAVLAGGCFWGVQAVFQHVNGVQQVLSGYAGGEKATAEYETVSTGGTGHAESVQISYDPKQISYGRLLQIYFSVAHDPTELNFQGPDHGTQYRSAIFATSDDQARIADGYIAQLNQAKVFGAPIATTVTPLKGFFPAEDYHQDYATLHPDSAYIAINDLPKVEHLAQLFPEAFRKDPKLVSH